MVLIRSAFAGFVSGLGLQLIWIAASSPTSMLARVLAQGSWQSRIGMGALVLLCLLGLVEAASAVLCPARLALLHRYRGALWRGVAAAHGVVSLAALHAGMRWEVAIVFAWSAVGAATIAGIDLRNTSRQAQVGPAQWRARR